jgi:hypothetical protein
MNTGGWGFKPAACSALSSLHCTPLLRQQFLVTSFYLTRRDIIFIFADLILGPFQKLRFIKLVY